MSIYKKHRDSFGKPDGTTRIKKNIFGDEYEEHIDCHGKPGGTTRIKKNIFGDTYEEHTNDEGEIIGTSEKDDGSCYLTTACINARGLPNNCLELETLRNFRDQILIPTPEGRSAIKEYYRIAPGLVEEINNRKDASLIWGSTYLEIKKAVSLVLEGKFNEAFEHYKGMTSKLKNLCD